MPAIRAERTQRINAPTRDSYLRRRTLQGLVQPRLCNVIAEANELVTANERDAPNGLTSKREVPPGFPWLTPVLGSGSLPSTGQELRLDPHQQRKRIVHLLESQELRTQDDGLSASELCDSFLDSLIEDRIGRAIESDHNASLANPTESDPRPVDGDTARIALLTALLTRAYHLAKAWPPEAVGRWGSDRARLRDGERPASEPDLLVAEISHLLGVILDEPGTHESMVPVFERVRQDLNDHHPTVRLSRVRTLTEFVWYLLSRQRPPYPGWTDLLFELSLDQELSPEDGPGLPRPSFANLSMPGDPVRTVYAKVTERAWDFLMHEPTDGTGTIHQAVASLLTKQAALRTDPDSGGHLPVASAFVTTFDLELEMALLARGQEFVVVFPVHVHTANHMDEAHPRWLACRVVPDRHEETRYQLRKLRQPEAEHLFLVLEDEDDPFENRGLASLPIVVRLSGCPLIDLPDPRPGEPSDRGTVLFEQIRDSLQTADNDPISSISHAVLLDEYTATHPTTPESQSTGSSLPPVFSARTENIPRFWLVLGVQIRDTAVRQRLTSQIALASIEARAKTWPAPKSEGLFVNRSLEPVHRDLLFWWGFDVVNSDCEAFRSEIEHLTLHVCDPYRDVRRLRAETCRLAAGAAR